MKIDYILASAPLVLASIYSKAFAADAAPPQQGGSGMLVFMLVLLVMMYLMIWRPQQKRVKAQTDLINGIQKGDEVVTQGGMLAVVRQVLDSHFIVELNESTQVTIAKSAVSSALPKGTMKSVLKKD